MWGRGENEIKGGREARRGGSQRGEGVVRKAVSGLWNRRVWGAGVFPGAAVYSRRDAAGVCEIVACWCARPEAKRMDLPGFDPGTSRMLSAHSTN